MKLQQGENSDHSGFMLSGTFTYSDRLTFRPVLESIEAKRLPSVTLDLSQLTYIDSAGLGMLLLARETAQSSGVTLLLSKPGGQVQKMLEISTFYQLFTITS